MNNNLNDKLNLENKKRVDLHLHTTHSDGTDSVEELLQNAQKANMGIISITDHDSVGAYYELEKNKNIRDKFSGKIIVGAEIKTFYKRVPIEVLAYGIDYKKINIHKVDQDAIQKDLLKSYAEILRKNNFVFDENELYIDRENPKKQWASFTVANEILAHPENSSIIKKIGEFTASSFYRVHQSNVNSIFYADETVYSIEINEAIKRIHDAGGLAFLAHGWIYPYENKEAILEEIATNTEIDGFECIYPLFSEEERTIIKNICKKHGKYMSGGSDYHADNKPDIKIGTGINNNISITEDFISPWIDKVRTI